MTDGPRPVSNTDQIATAARFSANLSRLVCPACRASLEVIEDQGLASSPGIRCSACRRIYPVIDGLPVLLAARGALTSETNV